LRAKRGNPACWQNQQLLDRQVASDIGNALGVISAGDWAKFTLPENFRKKVQDALTPNV
jgi:uncharacterized protein YdaT